MSLVGIPPWYEGKVEVAVKHHLDGGGPIRPRSDCVICELFELDKDPDNEHAIQHDDDQPDEVLPGGWEVFINRPEEHSGVILPVCDAHLDIFADPSDMEAPFSLSDEEEEWVEEIEEEVDQESNHDSV